VYADGGAAAGLYRYGAQYIPEGSPNLQFHPNNSGYLPVPGDLIIESWSSGWGHVSVVDRTVGNFVYAVEQNATLSGRHTYTLTGSMLTGPFPLWWTHELTARIIREKIEWVRHAVASRRSTSRKRFLLSWTIIGRWPRSHAILMCTR